MRWPGAAAHGAAQEDPRPLLRRRLAEAEARPPLHGCPCAEQFGRVLERLGR